MESDFVQQCEQKIPTDQDCTIIWPKLNQFQILRNLVYPIHYCHTDYVRYMYSRHQPIRSSNVTDISQYWCMKAESTRQTAGRFHYQIWQINILRWGPHSLMLICHCGGPTFWCWSAIGGLIWNLHLLEGWAPVGDIRPAEADIISNRADWNQNCSWN